jgi:Zn-dependent peptidase ImmA (M78 family)
MSAAMPGRDTNIGAKRARELRAELGLAPEDPVGCLLTAVEERLGIPVVLAALPGEVAGCCWRDGETVLLWVNAGGQVPARQRFTLAHELGHVRCGHPPGVPVDTFETLAGRSPEPREVQANAFAAALLAPADGVRAMLDGEPTLEDVVRIAARYGVSFLAALYRLGTLGLSRRVPVLDEELRHGHASEIWDRLGLAPVDDAIAAADAGALPRLSPALDGTALAALIRGDASLGTAAEATGCTPEDLGRSAGTIGM